MTDLASTTDLEARLGRTLTTAESNRAAALLADASALIRNYTKQTFSVVAGDVIRLRTVGTWLRLPQQPVTAVNSVTALEWGGLPNLILPVGFWGWDGIDQIEIAPFNSDIWLSLPTLELGQELPDTYEVNYDHGDATVPADVNAVCCGMVNRVLLSPSLVEGMNTERIGQYSYGMQQGGGGAPGATVRLSDVDKETLQDYRRKATTIQLAL